MASRQRRRLTLLPFSRSQGQVVKDLSALNRDLSKVLVLDTDSSRFSLHPENGVELKKWTGDRKDTELVDILSFLEAIAIYNIADVRPVLKKYEGQYLPEAFARAQREDKEKRLAEWKAAGGKSGGSGGGGVASWFGGLKSAGTPSGSTAGDGPPKTLFEQEQERFRQQYLEEQKYWAENGEAMRKAAKEEQEKQMANMKLSVFDMLSGKQFQAAEQQAGGAGK